MTWPMRVLVIKSVSIKIKFKKSTKRLKTGI